MNKRWLCALGALVCGGALAFAVACSGDDYGGGAKTPAQRTPVRTEAPTATVTPGNTPSETPSGAVTDVDVNLTDFTITPDTAIAERGRITFHLTNTGLVPHNLHVIKTDRAASDLPYSSGSQIVDEASLLVIGQSEEINPRMTGTVIANLLPGNYVLICNLPTHYAQGMQVAFTVE